VSDEASATSEATSDATDATADTLGDLTSETLEESTSSQDACAFEPSGPLITIRVTNMTQQPVFFDAVNPCDPPPGLRIEAGGSFRWFARACELACADASAGECGTSCPAECEATTVLRLDPGGTYEQLWAGGEYVDYVIGDDSADCFGEECPESCVAPVPLPEGIFELISSVRTGCSAGASGGCECEPNAEGYCFGKDDDLGQGDELVHSVEFTFPSTENVELILD
jgi:hypothetical protein